MTIDEKVDAVIELLNTMVKIGPASIDKLLEMDLPSADVPLDHRLHKFTDRSGKKNWAPYNTGLYGFVSAALADMAIEVGMYSGGTLIESVWSLVCPNGHSVECSGLVGDPCHLCQEKIVLGKLLGFQRSKSWKR